MIKLCREIVPGFEVKEETNKVEEVSAQPNNKEAKLKDEFLKEMIEAVEDQDFYKLENMTVNVNSFYNLVSEQ